MIVVPPKKVVSKENIVVAPKPLPVNHGKEEKVLLFIDNVFQKDVDTKSSRVTDYRKILMSSSIAKSHKISADEKKFLRQYRRDNNVSNEEHEAVLKEFRWTVDEYEDGERVIF